MVYHDLRHWWCIVTAKHAVTVLLYSCWLRSEADSHMLLNSTICKQHPQKPNSYTLHKGVVFNDLDSGKSDFFWKDTGMAQRFVLSCERKQKESLHFCPCRSCRPSGVRVSTKAKIRLIFHNIKTLSCGVFYVSHRFVPYDDRNTKCMLKSVPYKSGVNQDRRFRDRRHTEWSNSEDGMDGWRANLVRDFII